MKLLDKRKLLVLTLLLAGLVSGSVFAATTGGGDVTITSGSSLPGGGVADVTPLDDTFVLYQGNAQKISGVELYRIDLGSPTLRDEIRVHLSLLNPQAMSQVLNNPNSWVELSLAYEVASGEDFVLSTGEKVKVADLRTTVNNHMTRRHGDVTLLPTMGGDSIDTSTYWVLGSIVVPGGSPPGQQTQVGDLNILIDVRK